MKKTLVMMLIAGLFVVSASAVFAQEAVAPETVEVAAPAVVMVEGTVAAVDLEKSTLTIKAEDAVETVVALDAATAISKEGQALTVAELTVGSQIAVGCVMVDGNNVAQTIAVK